MDTSILYFSLNLELTYQVDLFFLQSVLSYSPFCRFFAISSPIPDDAPVINAYEFFMTIYYQYEKD